jgi:uncharacterized membrane protein YkvA (DUF1232 family)
MTLNSKQTEQVKEQFERAKKNMDREGVEDAASAGSEKLRSFGGRVPGVLAEVIEDIRCMIALLRDWVNGDYTDVPWGVIASIAAALAYFACPIDIIPDLIPIVGFVDDVLVITLCLQIAKDDLTKYRAWCEA